MVFIPCLIDSAWSWAKYPQAALWPQITWPPSTGNSRSASSMYPGAVFIRHLSKVVLPVPLRPIKAIFSLRSTAAEKFGQTFTPL